MRLIHNNSIKHCDLDAVHQVMMYWLQSQLTMNEFTYSSLKRVIFHSLAEYQKTHSKAVVPPANSINPRTSPCHFRHESIITFLIVPNSTLFVLLSIWPSCDAVPQHYIVMFYSRPWYFYLKNFDYSFHKMIKNDLNKQFVACLTHTFTFTIMQCLKTVHKCCVVLKTKTIVNNYAL